MGGGCAANIEPHQSLHTVEPLSRPLRKPLKSMGRISGDNFISTIMLSKSTCAGSYIYTWLDGAAVSLFYQDVKSIIWQCLIRPSLNDLI